MGSAGESRLPWRDAAVRCLRRTAPRGSADRARRCLEGGPGRGEGLAVARSTHRADRRGLAPGRPAADGHARVGDRGGPASRRSRTAWIHGGVCARARGAAGAGAARGFRGGRRGARRLDGHRRGRGGCRRGVRTARDAGRSRFGAVESGRRMDAVGGISAGAGRAPAGLRGLAGSRERLGETPQQRCTLGDRG